MATLSPEQTAAYAGADPAGLIEVMAGLYFPRTPVPDVAAWRNQVRQTLRDLAERVRHDQLGPAAAADLIDRRFFGRGTQVERRTSEIVDILREAPTTPDPALVTQARRLLRQHAPAAKKAARERAAAPAPPAAGRPADPPRRQAGQAGVAATSAPVNAEVTTLDATRTFLTGLADHLRDQVLARTTTARTALAGRHADTGTLGLLDRVHTHTTALIGTCEQALDHVNGHHGLMEAAVDGTPEAADLDFYRPDTPRQEASPMASPSDDHAAPATAEPVCTAINFTTEHPFEHDPSAAAEPDWPEGYERCCQPAGAQVHHSDDLPDSPQTDPDRTDRDRLARGAYIAAWSSPQWQRDRAREWDAGRVEAQPRDAAYAHADAILADRAQIAAGPGAARLETMRDNGITRCPSWCPQADDEHDHEAHIGPPTTFTSADGDTVTVRPRVSWWSDIEPAVELSVTPAEGGDGTLVLTAAELGRLQQLSSEALDQAQQHDDATTESGKPAYPGAYSETIDVAHDVTDPAAAAAAIDLQARASGYYLAENSDDDSTGPYLDWSSRTEPGVRHLEVGDGTDTTSLSVTTPQLQQLHDGIGRLVGVVGVVDSGVEDPGQLSLDDEGDGAYIDWSMSEDGIRYVEFGDGFDAVRLELTDAQLREWHERLALQLQLDEAEET